MSVLAVLKKVNIAVPYLDNMRRWIDNRMLPLQSGSLSSLSQGAKKMIADSEDFREYLMQFAQEADFNISDIKIQKMAALFGHTVKAKPGAKAMFCLRTVRVQEQNVWSNLNRLYIHS